MSGTISATVLLRPDSRAWAAGFGAYPSRSATARTCSRVTALIRPGRVNDRETVDGATPAARATSVIVGRRRGRGEFDEAIWTGYGNFWQTVASDRRRFLRSLATGADETLATSRKRVRMDTTTESRRTPGRAALAAWSGSALEYYDLAIYGTASALVFPKIFFPEGNESAATIASLATFGVAYVARPIGSFIMGHIGDRLGRKKVMVGTLLLMGISTFLVGCLPTYGQVGMLAPVLLVTLRLLQGLSAAGEQAGANSMSFEHAPEDQRGFYTSFTLSGTQGGQVLAPAVFLPLAAVLSDDQLQTWGWRGPFLLSAIVVFVGLYIRLKLEETPEFRAEEQHDEVAKAPLGVLFRGHWQNVLRVFFAAFIAMVNTMFQVFALNFATSDDFGIGFGNTFMLWLAIISNITAHFH